MQIVELPVCIISVQLESAIRKKELKVDQIFQAFNALSAKKKKQKTSHPNLGHRHLRFLHVS